MRIVGRLIGEEITTHMSQHPRKAGCTAVIGLLALWVHTSAANALPKAPDNAALLYCQAALIRAELRVPVGIDYVRRGADPDEKMKAAYEQLQAIYGRGDANMPRYSVHAEGKGNPEGKVREYFQSEDYRRAVELTLAATRIPKCDWGLLVSGRASPEGRLPQALRQLVYLLETHAKLLARYGQYAEAIETIEALRRFSSHVGDDTYLMWIWSPTAESQALDAARHLLSRMPADNDLLARLDAALADEKRPPWHPRETLMKWYDTEIASLEASIDLYSDWREAFLARLDGGLMQEGDAGEKLIRNATSAGEALDRLRAAYEDLVDPVIVALEGDGSYRDKHAKIAQLKDKVYAGIEAGDIIILVTRALSVEHYYQLHVKRLALAHAVQAAILVYRMKAEKGRLPEALPDGLPGDPYSGKDFDYAITEEGFTLRCRAMAVGYNQGPRQFDFKVRENEER